MIAATSLASPTINRARKIGGYVLRNGNGHHCLTVSQRKGNASIIFSNGLPANLKHASRLRGIALRLICSPPTPSAQEVMNTDMSSDCCVSSTSSRVNLLVLTKVTFCPHSSLHFCSFTAVIRAGHDQPEFSFDPFTRLIKEIGHVGEVTVSTVKPLSQHQFLLTGFSRHTLPRNLHS